MTEFESNNPFLEKIKKAQEAAQHAETVAQRAKESHGHEQSFESMVKIAKARARTEAIKKGDMELVQEINSIHIVPNNQVPDLNKMQLTIRQFERKYLED